MPKFIVIFALLLLSVQSQAQSLNAGTLMGMVTDAAMAPIASADVEMKNTITGYVRRARTDSDGSFTIHNIPPNRYLLQVSFSGFQPHRIEVNLQTAVPYALTIRLELAGQQTSITVRGTNDGVLEARTVSSLIADRQLLSVLPAISPDSGLNDSITYTTPGVAADSNGFFHPMGDHAQVSYVLDGQPIADQRNKVFSTSIPANAIESMEVISGSPPAEYGDKTSLVVNAITRSGLGQKPSGSFLADYGSFGTVGEETSLAFGRPRWGNFLAANAERTGRFLDTPELRPLHSIGNTVSVFDRLDLQPRPGGAFHLNLLAARNWMQVPNTYAQPLQDQRQKVVSFNIAPGYQHTTGAHGLFSANTYVRRDQVDYYPSREPLHDSPATLSQSRSLTNFGIRSDLSRVDGRHAWKVGLNASQTRLDEKFTFGVTDPLYNAPCLNPITRTTVSGFLSSAECGPLGLQENPDFLKSLVRYDLSRGGGVYHFAGQANVNQVAAFGQDSIALGNLTLSVGLRFDHYRGLTRGGGAQPRGAFSYLFKPTRTVLRGGYSRTIETPTNENLVVSSSTGPGGLASNLFQGDAQQQPLPLGFRNQYDAGLQQSLGKWVLLDVSYFRKYTRNAYDYDAIFSTPILFPIAWSQSKLDGIAARITTTDLRGLRAYVTMGHANARFFGPEIGGVVFNSNLATGAYRQDHDQVYQQNVNVHYQPRKDDWWTNISWRYDSGLVVGAVSDLTDALTLTAQQQATIGFSCGAERASLQLKITSCAAGSYGADRIVILAPGASNDDRNPARTKSRHIFSLGVGTDNLFRTERVRTVVRFTVLNVTDEAALYNFLSPFSGTHWVAPRSYQVRLGWAF